MVREIVRTHIVLRSDYLWACQLSSQFFATKSVRKIVRDTLRYSSLSRVSREFRERAQARWEFMASVRRTDAYDAAHHDVTARYLNGRIARLATNADVIERLRSLPAG